MIQSVRLIVGLEVHVELATRTKMFSRALNPAGPEFREHAARHAHLAPNSLIDSTVLALPGSLPVVNRAAVEMAMLVGLALACSIARVTTWDRKSYFYPDMPKAYQISQYDLPLCFDGAVDLPAADTGGFPDLSSPGRRIGIIRAHLEEDAGKLLHEAPGGGRLDCSIVDLNRAGTPLLEIVTQPDFTSAAEVVLFARLLRATCRALGVTDAVMEAGQMRFEPNINCELTLADARTVRTPVVEIKNLNSLKSLRAAVEFEAAEQPRRWREDGREMGAGMKVTRGWDDARGVSFVQREKEDAPEYRYFPDPDLVPVEISSSWRDAVASRLPELPLERFRRYAGEYSLGVKEAWALAEERGVSDYYETAIAAMTTLGTERERAGKAAANILLRSAFRRAKDAGVEPHLTGASAEHLAAIAFLRDRGRINNQAVDPLFDALCDASRDAVGGAGAGATAPASALASVETLADSLGLLIETDHAALDAWIAAVLTEHPAVVNDVRAGKTQAVGRLVGEVMKRAGGKADAKAVRERLLQRIG